ncbi:NUDIX hydrolase [Acidipropionibacterium jensenii]|uniref:NUDIX hydrolase n=1 Tax=Acidipropionibacterium jensenii TaxID=1749 RepID=A0A3T0S347_9ACTN|nr:NUDIX hydrolase [Acidipropionibacterium jensenii]AZZ41946.1 NUDIX hydrolase [Acidipropionibacterium jensenii]
MMRAPFRDQRGVAKYRHEVLGVVLRAGPVGSPGRPAELQVLVRRRDREPFAGKFALPSGPVEVTETMEEALARHLREQLGLETLRHCEQLATLSDPGRDPFERTIATAYLGLVPWEDARPRESGARWTAVAELPDLAFDHHLVVGQAVDRLRGKVSYTNIALALAPPEFTMATLRGIYEAVLGREIDVTNLSRVLRRRGQIARVGTLGEAGARGGRPPSTWRFTEDSYRVTDPFAVLGPGRNPTV